MYESSAAALPHGSVQVPFTQAPMQVVRIPPMLPIASHARTLAPSQEVPLGGHCVQPSATSQFIGHACALVHVWFKHVCQVRPMHRLVPFWQLSPVGPASVAVALCAAVQPAASASVNRRLRRKDESTVESRMEVTSITAQRS